MSDALICLICGLAGGIILAIGIIEILDALRHRRFVSRLMRDVAPDRDAEAKRAIVAQRRA